MTQYTDEYLSDTSHGWTVPCAPMTSSAVSEWQPNIVGTVDIIGAGQSRLPESPAERRRKFLRLTRKWQSETMHLSSAAEMAMHPAYQQIIGMGKVAVPLIMEQLTRSPGHWFWALSAITGVNPAVPVNDRGNLRAMADAWLRWWKGRNN